MAPAPADPASPDPAAAVSRQTLSGREYLERRRADPGFSPAVTLLGIGLNEIADGRVTLTYHPRPAEHYNSIGCVHGGFVATVLDTAMGCAVQTLLPPGRAFATLEFKVNFVRRVTAAGGLFRAEGQVLHCGRQTATAEAKLFDADHQLCAHASTTGLFFEVPAPATP